MEEYSAILASIGSTLRRLLFTKLNQLFCQFDIFRAIAKINSTVQ